MPKEIWVVQDTTTNLYLSVYSTELENCQWVTQPLPAMHFNSQQEANDIIDSWGLGQQSRFIGSNPPLH